MLLRRLAIAALLAAPLASVSALEMTDVIGTWKIDQDAVWETMKAKPEFASIPADRQDMIKGMMMAKLGTMSWNFTAEGATMSGGAPGAPTTLQKPKSWTSTGPKTATVVPADEKQGPIAVELKDDGKLYLTPTAKNPREKMTLVMVRAPAAAAAATTTDGAAAPAAK